MQKIKDLAASNAVTWGTIADSIDANFSETITEHQDISGKQDKLVSGVNIKTINGTSILGSGNITQDLSGKQDKLVSGVNIKTVNGTSILGGGNLTLTTSGSCSTTNLIPKPVSSTFYNGKKIAMIGDSITAGVGAGDNSKRYTTVLAELLGATEVNLGASGTVLCTGGHRGCNIGKLTAANINGCSAVTIMMGINDWDQAKSDYYKLGEYGTTDTSTIYGAVDMWCKRIVELRETSGLEDTKFFFITPIVTSWNNSVGGSNWDQNKTNIHGFKLRDLCQAIINVCADYEIPVLDMNKYSGIYYNSAEDNTTSTYFGDGIHPNAAGHGQIANVLKDYLLENPTYVETGEALNYVLQSLLGETNKISYPNFDNVETFSLDLENITLSPSTLSLVEGETQNITATLTPSNTTQTSLKWESSNSSVAVVNDGVVTALAEGSVTITCKSVDNPSISATASVVVSKSESADITGLLISESTKTVKQGETATLSVSYVPTSTTQTGVVWSSDDENVATVVGNGDSCTVTAVGEGQCNITATSSVNSSIKASCFFTTSNTDGDTPTDVDTLDVANYTLGSNVSFNAETGEMNGTASGETLRNTANAATFNVPLKAGMEVEVQHTFPSSYSNYVGFGVDTTTDPSQIELGGGFPRGKFIVYYDVPNKIDDIETWDSATGPHDKLFIDAGTNVSPRIATIGRDINGKLYVKHNGTTLTSLPYYDCIATANNAENLYVWFGGCDNKATWKITYFGVSRDMPTEPDTPTEPETSLYTLGANVTYNSEDNTLTGTQATSYGNETSVAVYNEPLKPGMEVEIVAEFGDAAEFAAIGVDTTNNISDINGITSGGKKYQTGLLNAYFDNPEKYKNVQYIMPKEATLSKSVLCTEQNNVSPRTTIIKRDANGVITGTCNGVTLNFPDNEHTTLANNTEDLYVFIGGIGTQITWKFNYFGELRDASTEPEEPETPETPTPDTPDNSTWTLGTNVVYNSENDTLTGKATGFGNDNNAAIYNIPLKAGMEVEIEQTIPNGYNAFLGWGVDKSTNISELKHSGQFITGMFSFYIDAGKDNVQSLGYGSITPKTELGVNGGKTSPRVSVIKRDENGVLSATFGGNAVTMPSHEGVTAANATEDLYVWIGGIDSSSTWKINYIGEARE